MSIFKIIIFLAFSHSLGAEQSTLDVYRARNIDKIQNCFTESKKLLSRVLPKELIINENLQMFPLGYVKNKSIVSESEIGVVVSAVVKFNSLDDVYLLSAVKYVESGRVVFLIRPAAFVKLNNSVFSLDFGYPCCGLVVDDSKLEAIVNNFPLDEIQQLKRRAFWEPVGSKDDLKGANSKETTRSYLPPLIINK